MKNCVKIGYGGNYKNIWVKGLLVLLILLTVIPASACGKKEESRQILIGAAASLKSVLTEIQNAYVRENPKIKLSFTFASSGTLEQQVREGSSMDLFIPAAAKQMNSLEADGLIIKTTRIDLLKNEIVLILPKESKLEMSSFNDILKAQVIALGEPESVPAGQYAKEVFEKLGIWDAVNKQSTFGTNVTEVLSWVSSGNADAGVVYETDAKTDEGVKIIGVAPAGSHSDIVYPAAVVKGSDAEKQAKVFLDFLRAEEAGKVFEKYGFTVTD